MHVLRALTGLTVVAVLHAAASAAPWRSALYPANWTPGSADAEGRFLHDFSYAGYRMGDVPIPDAPPGATLDVTASPYGADATGAQDSTAAIQHALDDAAAAGGGIVYLPAGTYRIKPPAGAVAALSIHASGVVLRGAGSGQTFLFNDEPVMRSKRIINVRPDPNAHFNWAWGDADTRLLVDDLSGPTTRIPVADSSGYQAGDWIVVRADATADWIADHGMTGTWQSETIGGPIFYRRIVAVDAATHTLTIDVPTRYPLRMRDAARINRIAPHLEEIGIEHLSIGNRENTRTGTGDNDYSVANTGAYEMHDSFAIYFTHVVNGWVRDVMTYRPAVNTRDVHVLSNALRLDASRFVTVSDCDFRRPQYLGAGGNGYMFVMTGSENLITRSHAEYGRHNFDFGLVYVSGNVIHRSSAKGGRLPVDFHMQLSMANLIDNLSVDDDSIEAVRRTCCDHGHSTTQSVIWNTEGIRYPSDQFFTKFIVDSAQFGHGYVIGTRGAATAVRIGSGADTAPADWLEGAGAGDELVPASLYEDQLARRHPSTEDPDDDGTPEPDAGVDDTREPPAPGGGCMTGSAGASWLVLVAIALCAITQSGSARARRRAASRSRP